MWDRRCAWWRATSLAFSPRMPRGGMRRPSCSIPRVRARGLWSDGATTSSRALRSRGACPRLGCVLSRHCKSGYCCMRSSCHRCAESRIPRAPYTRSRMRSWRSPSRAILRSCAPDGLLPPPSLRGRAAGCHSRMKCAASAARWYAPGLNGSLTASLSPFSSGPPRGFGQRGSDGVDARSQQNRNARRVFVLEAGGRGWCWGVRCDGGAHCDGGRKMALTGRRHWWCGWSSEFAGGWR
mmetsp:Transcript_15778/g.51529  ORF Transcript_15778/g.51529 Transcript_15778/m.51529 type:complete len:238 (+) Transcript_15778:591-1304(+)